MYQSQYRNIANYGPSYPYLMGNPSHPNGQYLHQQYQHPYNQLPFQNHSNPYFNQPPQQFNEWNQPQMSQGSGNYKHPQQPNAYSSPYYESLFQNPLQPMEDAYYQKNNHQSFGYANPYPKPGMMPKQPSGVGSILNSFKGQDGSIDFNKMMNTAGSMMNAMSQVSSMVKGFGSFFNG